MASPIPLNIYIFLHSQKEFLDVITKLVIALIMAKKGRPIPKEENRGPRNKAMSVYFSEEEHAHLEKVSNSLGFNSKSALISYVIGNAINGGFSGWTFMKMGHNFAKMLGEVDSTLTEIPMPLFTKKKNKQ